MISETKQEKKRRQAREHYNKDITRSRKIKRDAMVRAKTKGTWGAYLMFRRYGITQEQFQDMKVSQGNKCRLCCKEFDGLSHESKPHVDHSHASGKVRSLLCACCNRGLGQFKDNPDLLRAAAAYLEGLQ